MRLEIQMDASVVTGLSRKRIGEGSYGVVFQSSTNGPRRLAPVIKVFKCPCVTEINIINRLRHPNMCSSIGMRKVEMDEDKYLGIAIVLPRYARDLGDANVSIPVAHRFLKEIFSALAYLRLNRILHLDIKPQNILVDERMDHAYLTDFGLSVVLPPGVEQIFSNTLRCSLPPPELVPVIRPAGCCAVGFDVLEGDNIGKGYVYDKFIDMYCLGLSFLRISKLRISNITNTSPIQTEYLLTLSQLMRANPSQRPLDIVTVTDFDAQILEASIPVPPCRVVSTDISMFFKIPDVKEIITVAMFDDEPLGPLSPVLRFFDAANPEVKTMSLHENLYVIVQNIVSRRPDTSFCVLAIIVHVLACVPPDERVELIGAICLLALQYVNSECIEWLMGNYIPLNLLTRVMIHSDSVLFNLKLSYIANAATPQDLLVIYNNLLQGVEIHASPQLEDEPLPMWHFRLRFYVPMLISVRHAIINKNIENMTRNKKRDKKRVKSMT
jgi:serine/threonine protein kinase